MNDHPNLADFPFAVRMDWNAYPAEEAYRWCREQFGSLNYKYCDWMVSPSWNVDTYYFKQEKHRTWFILKWSGSAV